MAEENKSEQELNDRLGNLIDAVGKDVGKDVIKLVSSGFERRPCAASGIPSLDRLLNGGLPEGTLVDLYGPEGSGKTTLALHFLANQIRRNRIAFIVDAEHKLDPLLASKIGVDLSKHPLTQPATAEEAFEIIFSASENMQPGDIILVDSAAALVPKAMIEHSMDQKFMGGNSIVVSQGLKKILHTVSVHGVIVIFINQLREKIGVMFGNPETTPCGRALKYHSNAIIEVRKTGFIKEGENTIGQTVSVKTVKTSHCPPFQTVELKLKFGEGFDWLDSTIQLAFAQGVLERKGPWIYYKEEKWQGEANLYNALLIGDSLKAELYNQLKI